jgi:hypothetical protein
MKRLSALVITLGILLFVSTSNASAQLRTCCTDAGGGTASNICDGCRAAGVETKNFGDSCGGAAAGSCVVCPATHPRSNVCGGGSGSQWDICTALAITPNSLILNVGQSATVSFRMKQGSFSKLNVVRSTGLSTTSSVTPTFFGASTLPLDNKYEYRTATVRGLAVGQNTFELRSTDTFAGYEILRCRKSFSVNVVAASTPTPVATVKPTPTPTPTPASLQCYPGAKCDVVGGGAPSTTKSMACSMPVVPASVVSSFGATGVSYELSCDVFETSGNRRPAFVTRTQANNPVFASFTTSLRGVYQCRFRYCLVRASGNVCLPWSEGRVF